MSTIIYPSPIYGPVHSRRLGLSLGINLMPADGKICTFDCLYCECGFNAERRTRSAYPTREAVAEALERQLIAMHNDGQHPDVLTFAGNGEPTSNPHFAGIIDDTVRLLIKETHCSINCNFLRQHINRCIFVAGFFDDTSINKMP